MNNLGMYNKSIHTFVILPCFGNFPTGFLEIWRVVLYNFICISTKVYQKKEKCEPYFTGSIQELHNSLNPKVTKIKTSKKEKKKLSSLTIFVQSKSNLRINNNWSNEDSTPSKTQNYSFFLYERIILLKEEYSQQRGQEVAKEPRISLLLNAPHKTRGNSIPYLRALMALEPTSSTSQKIFL